MKLDIQIGDKVEISLRSGIFYGTVVSLSKNQVNVQTTSQVTNKTYILSVLRDKIIKVIKP